MPVARVNSPSMEVNDACQNVTQSYRVLSKSVMMTDTARFIRERLAALTDVAEQNPFESRGSWGEEQDNIRKAER